MLTTLIHTETLKELPAEEIFYYLTDVIIPSLTLPANKNALVIKSVSGLLEEFRARQPSNYTLYINGYLNIRPSMLYARLGLDEFDLTLEYMENHETIRFPEMSLILLGNDSLAVQFCMYKTGHTFILKYSDILCNPDIDILAIPNGVLAAELPDILCEVTELEHSFCRLQNKKAEEQENL